MRAANAAATLASSPTVTASTMSNSLSAAAVGGGLTAVFVPADALPDARADTPVDDVVAFIVRDEEVATVAPVVRAVSERTAALLAELEAFRASRV